MTVAVVGAGPVGLVTALLLARHGVRSVVLEKRPRPYPLPRAVHLDDECVRVLQSAGVADDFTRISRPADGLRLLGRDHRPIAEFRRSRSVGEHGYPQASLFDQPDLEELLRRAVRSSELIDLRFGSEVSTVDVGGRVGYAGGLLEVDAVVGCDGSASLVRRVVGARLRRLAADQRWFVIDVLGDPPVRPGDWIEQVCDRRRPATYLRIGERRLRWEFRMRPGETASGLTARLDDLVRPWLPEGLGDRTVLRTSEYTFRAAVADRWRKGRILIAGDAAHLTPPFIGQGLGSGLRDAANLSWKLARVLDGRAGDDLLDTYPDERRPHAVALVRLAAFAGAVMGSPAAQAFRVVGRSSWATGRLLAGVGPPLRAGALVPGRHPGLVGTSFPQIPMMDAPGSPSGPGSPSRLDDFLGAGFALLTLRGASPVGIGGRAASWGARVVPVNGPGFEAVRAWMVAHGCEAVLLRPDRVVLATAPVVT